MQLSISKSFARIATAGLIVCGAALFAATPAQASTSINFTSATTSSLDFEINTNDYYQWALSKVEVSMPYENSSAYTEVAESNLQALSSNKLRVSGLKAGVNYNVKLTYKYLPTEKSTTASEGTWTKYNVKTVSTAPGTPKITYQSSNGAKLDLAFNARACDGYQIFLDPAKSGAKNKNVTKDAYGTTAKTYSANSVAVTKKTAYSAKVRTWVKTDAGTKLYSAWSKTVTLLPQPIISKIKMASNGGAKLTWNKVAGAKSYTIYASTKSNSGYKKIGTTKKTTTTVTKVKGKKLRTGKTYYVYVIANKGKFKSPKLRYSSFYKYRVYR